MLFIHNKLEAHLGSVSEAICYLSTFPICLAFGLICQQVRQATGHLESAAKTGIPKECPLE